MTPAPATFVFAAPIDTTAQWADLDIPAIAAALQSTGVYAPADQVSALEQVVAGAASDGYDLQIVVLETSYSPFTVYRDIATELQSQVGGTVLVIGPSGMGTASDEFSRVELEDGTGEVKAGTSPAVAAQQIYDRATEPHVDWTVLTILLIVLVVLGAVGARIAMVRRRG
ncbi:DUF6676 family protein [Gordonia alkaliphila]|uniref:TPM domain-containing protein n=1 Tax=Gordonia alkaliphila TaxID=1053547 RepID=A0ABP8YTV6_9ACTN